MIRLTKEYISRYECTCCRFYGDRWTCWLEECFFITEAAQEQTKAQIDLPVAKWEVIV